MTSSGDEFLRRVRDVRPSGADLENVTHHAADYDNLRQEERSRRRSQDLGLHDYVIRVFVFVFVMEKGCEFQFPLLRATLTC